MAVLSHVTPRSEWQSLAEAFDGPVLMVDERAVVVRANALAEQLFGTSTLPNLHSVATGEPWSRVLALFEAVGARTPTARAQAADVSTGVTWDVSVSWLPDDTRLVMLRDITNLLALERAARQNERIADLGRLVGNVAHEVRNPLFAMSATVDALEARFSASELQLGRYITSLRRELRRITDLMHDLLEYGKPPLLDTKVEPMIDAVSDALNVARRSAAKKQIAFDLADGTSRDALVLMDRARVAQALQNVIENAIHFSPAASTIAIRVSVVDEEGMRWASCSVDDCGPGFPENVLPLVFEPFYTTRPGGTGLGLSIVQRVVQMHGGRAFAANRPEGGAGVTVWLPLRSESE